MASCMSFVWFFVLLEVFNLYFQNIWPSFKLLKVYERIGFQWFLSRIWSFNIVLLCFITQIHVSLHFCQISLHSLMNICHGHEWGCMRKLVTFSELDDFLYNYIALIYFSVYKLICMFICVLWNWTFVFLAWGSWPIRVHKGNMWFDHY